MLLTGLFLIAAMAILVMKGREEQVQLQKRYEELLMDYPGTDHEIYTSGSGRDDCKKGIPENFSGLWKKEKAESKTCV